MEQVIKINVPEGKKAVYNETTQVIEFVNTEPIRSRSWEEFCKNHPDSESEYSISSATTSNIINRSIINRTNKCWLETRDDAEGILALIQLTRLHDEWVGDKRKISYNSIYWDYESNEFRISNNFHHLWFPNYRMAEEFLDCFRDLIEKAKRFI